MASGEQTAAASTSVAMRDRRATRDRRDWCRADGGRGFACTGPHFHASFGNDDLRRLVLNAILWTANIEVPQGGVQSTVLP